MQELYYNPELGAPYAEQRAGATSGHAVEKRVGVLPMWNASDKWNRPHFVDSDSCAQVHPTVPHVATEFHGLMEVPSHVRVWELAPEVSRYALPNRDMLAHMMGLQ